jgi:hypothetical protein
LLQSSMIRHTDTEMTVMKEGVSYSFLESRGMPLHVAGREHMEKHWDQLGEGSRGTCGQDPLLWFH